MRKYFKYKLIGLALIMAGMAGCNTADQDVSPVVSPDGYPVATFSVSPGTSVTEGDTIVYTVSINKMIDRSITFTFNQTGGTATEDDYIIKSGTIDPYTLSTTVSIITVNDNVKADAKTLIGEIGAFTISDRYLLNPSTVNEKPNITINNWVSPSLDIAFSWDQDILIGGDAYDASDYVDFDIFISTAEGFDINDPWSTELGIYGAATGAHPEHLSLSGLDDGEYILWTELWANGFAGEDTGDQTISIVTTFNRPGTDLVDLVVEQDPSQYMMANQPGYDDTPSTIFDAVCAKFVVEGNLYRILAFDGTEIGSGKGLKIRRPRPANIPGK